MNCLAPHSAPATDRRTELGEAILHALELANLLSVGQRSALLLTSRTDGWRGRPRLGWLHARTAAVLLRLALIAVVPDPDDPEASPFVAPTEGGRLLATVLQAVPPQALQGLRCQKAMPQPAAGRTQRPGSAPSIGMGAAAAGDHRPSRA